VVTHPTTNRPACGLSTAERTGSPVFHTLWSYVLGVGRDWFILKIKQALRLDSFVCEDNPPRNYVIPTVLEVDSLILALNNRKLFNYLTASVIGMSTLPTLVFVPGSWHKPTCYDKVIKLLQEEHKLNCISIILPSTAGDPSATFKDDLDVAREAISSETSQGRNVIVVAHSYGGMVGNSAIKGFAQPQDASKTSTTGYVIGLILIASGFTLTGLSFMDPFFGHPPPSWRVNSDTGYAEIVTSPRELFYHDLPAEEAEFWVSQLTTQTLKALFEGGEYTYAGWKDVPTWYIGTVEDRGLPVLAQRMQVGMARQIGGSVEHRELQTSHSPFLSQPEATVKIMLDAIEAFTKKPVGDKSEMSKRGNVIAVPRVNLWQPLTFFKFGIPLAVGHVIGRCVILFSGGRRLWKSRFGLRSV
jgi:pimeloyl-ACP methyl ester carboxylesterase